MNIFREIKCKITSALLRKLDMKCEHARPQDDVPDEKVLQYIVSDYRRMYNERHAIMNYIRSLEHIYEQTKAELYRESMMPNVPTRKRIVQDIRLVLYDMTKYHHESRKRLCESLGLANEFDVNSK